MHKELYHWSEAPVTCFYSWADDGKGRFVSNVQGLAFATPWLKGGVWSTTRITRTKTLLVFVGQAAAHFRSYDASKFDMIFKKPLGQYTTNAVGDLVWNENDAAVEGNVIIVGRIRIDPIVDEKRLLKLERERKRRALGWPFFGLALAIGLTFGLLDKFASGWLEPRKPMLNAAGSLLIMAAFAGVALAIALSWMLSSKPDIADDLKLAREKAHAKGLY